MNSTWQQNINHWTATTSGVYFVWYTLVIKAFGIKYRLIEISILHPNAFLEGNVLISPNTNDDGDLDSAPIDIEKKNAEKEAKKKVEGVYSCLIILQTYWCIIISYSEPHAIYLFRFYI